MSNNDKPTSPRRVQKGYQPKPVNEGYKPSPKGGQAPSKAPSNPPNQGGGGKK